ncbi:hypothetical protein BU25DRAFT_408261 [Macroventuria anomochaeta]|uniref:Uncharacterized protein n=1 Tax=Macroventuria anomochaeta TaxID=301207 RepID=A0ACB6SAN9_9PLEO|nr:uncharacterized protein BU25DRAFT_408261 [Macroventuria anomochaeta]KAF2630294.1 hypothetical protein BU25DRAFT_408261 [Macroventuria anomochaeta]
MDANYHATDSHNRYEQYLELLQHKITEYDVDALRTICRADITRIFPRANAICSTFSQHHSSTTMTGIKETPAEVEPYILWRQIPRQRI